MTTTTRTLGLVAAAGGAAWLAKFAVIAATDGAETGVADTTTSVLYLLGAALLCAGASCLTLRATRGRGRVATAAAVVAAPVVAILSFMLLDPLAQNVVGDAGPAWLQDESAIALTGAAWVVIGLDSWRRSSSRAEGSQASRAVVSSTVS